jgi:hypothetical protein
MRLNSLLTRGLIALSLTSITVLGFTSPALAAPVAKAHTLSVSRLSLPATPRAVVAAKAKQSIVLHWSKVAQADDYELVVDNRFYMGLGTSKTLRLNQGRHTVQVRATNAAGAGAWTKVHVFQSTPSKVSTSTSLIKG